MDAPGGGRAKNMVAVVGLGNPGWRYRRTRHNVGFRVAEEYAGRHGVRFERWFRMAARIARTGHAGRAVLAVKPQTYMNRSGLVVRRVMAEFDIGIGGLLVVADDASLPLGRFRVRPRGSDGGHKGLRSIIEEVGSAEFARVRVGIGGPDAGSLTDHVLAKFARHERTLAAAVVGKAADAVATVISDGIEPAMNAFNAMDLARQRAAPAHGGAQ